jgi:hypothetical protein
MADKYSSFNGLAFGPTSTGAFEIGDFATSNNDVFFALDQTTRPKALDICCDDGGTAIGAGSDVMPLRARMLIRTAISGTPDLSIHGLEGILKYSGVAVTAASNQAGVWAYFESVTGASFQGIASGLFAMVSLPTGATLNSGGVLAGINIGADSLAGTSTGDMSCIYIGNPGAGTWDYFLQTGNAPGFIAAWTTTSVLGVHKMACKIGGTVCYIPLITGT